MDLIELFVSPFVVVEDNHEVFVCVFKFVRYNGACFFVLLVAGFVGVIFG